MDELLVVTERPAMQYAHASTMARAPTVAVASLPMAPDLRHEEISALVTGADNTLLLTAAGRLYYTGTLQIFRPHDRGYAQSFTHVHIPVPVRAAAATAHCLVIVAEDGSVHVRGDPADGRLGIGDYADGRPARLPSSPAVPSPNVSPPAGVRRYYPSNIPIPVVHRPRNARPRHVRPPAHTAYDGVPAPVSYLYSFQRLVLPEPMTAVRLGAYCTLLLGESGCVYASGRNLPRFGEASSHSTVFVSLCFPTAIRSMEVDAGATEHPHMVFVTAAGELYLCGSNKYGRLGLWEDVEESPLTSIVFPAPVAAARVGEGSTMVLTTDGRLYGAGANLYGELAALPSSNYDFMEIPLPEALWVEAAAGRVGLLTGQYATVLVTPLTVYVLGHNHEGSLGRGADSSYHREFTALDFPSEVVIAAKSPHGLFIATRNKTLYVSGDDSMGVLGTGTGGHYYYPTPHPSFEKACALVPGCDG